MKNSAVIFLIILLSCCKQEIRLPPASYIHKILDTVDIDRSENILIYTINPNDCISCLNAFKSFNDKLDGDSGSKMYVILVDRIIEREAMRKKITYLDLNPQKNKAVLWSHELFDSINSCAGVNQAMTTVMVYNYKKDSVLFSKPVREVMDMKEISIELEKNISGN